MKKIALLIAALMIVSFTAAFAAETYTCEDIAGYYDIVFELFGQSEKDETVNLILTPNGHGRMNESTSTYTFDYYISGNRLLIVNDEEFVFEIENDSRIVLSLSYEGFEMDMPYIKRANVEGGQAMLGKWKLSGMEEGSIKFTKDILEMIGYTIEMTCYENGAIDWYAKTDTDDYIAQGWGRDANGLYIDNGGGHQYVEIEGNTMTVKLVAEGDVLIMTFERMD